MAYSQHEGEKGNLMECCGSLIFFFPLPHLAVKYCFFFRIIFPNYRLALNYYITDYTTTEKIKRNPI